MLVRSEYTLLASLALAQRVDSLILPAMYLKEHDKALSGELHTSNTGTFSFSLLFRCLLRILNMILFQDGNSH